MYAPHLFLNRQKTQLHERKYVGIVLTINEFNYFVPLSSFKEKHKKMKQSVDFIKLKDYAVLNLNNMFPVPLSECTYVEISKEKDMHYRALLQAEYRSIKVIQEKIRKNAANLYRLKINGPASPLTKRCNDFVKLEELCRHYR